MKSKSEERSDDIGMGIVFLVWGIAMLPLSVGFPYACYIGALPPNDYAPLLLVPLIIANAFKFFLAVVFLKN